jgi:hypothetical protein
MLDDLEMTTDAPFPLRRLAHGRTGDKGNRCCISVIAYCDEFWPLLLEQVTETAGCKPLRFRRPTNTSRYLLPKLGAMNFVIDDVLDGGVNDALNLDSHGKSLSFLCSTCPIRVPHALQSLLAGVLSSDPPDLFSPMRRHR